MEASRSIREDTMAFQPVPHCAIIEFRHLWDNQKVENSVYVLSNANLTEADLPFLAAALGNTWRTHALPLMSNAVQYASTYVRALHTATAPMYEDFTGAGTAGGTVSPALPNNCSWCVTFRTGLSGRSGRGRNYVIGLSEGRVDGNLVQLVTANAWVDVYEELKLTMADLGYTWTIVSRQQNKVRLPQGIPYPINAVGYIDRQIDSQRRRLPGRGD
jgi:hypothetical protein